MTYRIVITARVLADLAEQLEYICRDSITAAAKWRDGCLKKIDSLEFMPLSYPVAPETQTFQREIRQVLYHSHRILYEVIGADVRIMHIRHGARNTWSPDDESEPQAP